MDNYLILVQISHQVEDLRSRFAKLRKRWKKDPDARDKGVDNSLRLSLASLSTEHARPVHYSKEGQSLLQAKWMEVNHIASELGEMDVCMAIHETLKDPAYSPLEDARLHSMQICLIELTICQDFEGVWTVFQDLRGLTAQSDDWPIFAEMGTSLVNAAVMAGAHHAAGRMFDYMVESLSSKPDRLRRLPEAACWAGIGLKLAGKCNEAFLLLENDLIFSKAPFWRSRLAYELVSGFHREDGPEMEFILKVFQQARRRLSAAERDAAIRDFVQMAVGGSRAEDVFALWEYMRPLDFLPLGVSVTSYVMTAVCMMEHYLERCSISKAWEVFLTMPQEKIGGGLYMSLFGVAQLFIIIFGFFKKPELANKVFRAMNSLARTRKDAQDFAEAMYSMMLSCPDEFLPDGMLFFYDAFEFYAEDQDFLKLHEYMSYTVIDAWCWSDNISEAWAVFHSLLPVSKRASKEVLDLRLQGAAVIAECLLSRGQCEDAVNFFLDASDFTVNERYSLMWLEFAKDMVDGLFDRNGLKEVDRLYGYVRDSVPRRDACLAKFFRAARTALKGYSASGCWDKAVSLFDGLPNPGSSLLLERELGDTLSHLARSIIPQERTAALLKKHPSFRGSRLLRPPQASRKGRRGSQGEEQPDLADAAPDLQAEAEGEAQPDAQAPEKWLGRAEALVGLIHACIRKNMPDDALELTKIVPFVCDPALLGDAMKGVSGELARAFTALKRPEKVFELRELENMS